jgi:hypothetical protein
MRQSIHHRSRTKIHCFYLLGAMKVLELFVLCLSAAGGVVLALTERQEFQFVVDYCVARNFKSVTVIAGAPQESNFLPLLLQLNERGIRLAIESEVKKFHFSSFSLYLVMHQLHAIETLFHIKQVCKSVIKFQIEGLN